MTGSTINMLGLTIMVCFVFTSSVIIRHYNQDWIRVQFHFVGGVATILALHWLYAKSWQSGCWSDLANIKQNIINVKIHILERIKFIIISNKASMQSMILSMH